MHYDEVKTYLTPTNALFYNLCIKSCIQILHVLVLISHQHQGADTKISLNIQQYLRSQ